MVRQVINPRGKMTFRPRCQRNVEEWDRLWRCQQDLDHNGRCTFETPAEFHKRLFVEHAAKTKPRWSSWTEFYGPGSPRRG